MYLKHLLLVSTILAKTLVDGQSSFHFDPPIGWHSWQRYGCNLTEQDVIDEAERMIELGLNKLNNTYVIVDCWQSKNRSDDGHIYPDKERFPTGIRYLSKFLHSNNMKLGLTSSAGATTCHNRAGSKDNEFDHAF